MLTRSRVNTGILSYLNPLRGLGFSLAALSSFLFFFTDQSFAQEPDPTNSSELNYLRQEYSNSPLPTYSLQDGIRHNSSEFFTHPDFGKLTFSAPYGHRVVEDLSWRKEDERRYVDLDSQTYFYIEKSSRPINLYVDGFWRAIDPSLHKVTSDYYESGIQAYPSALSLSGQYSMLDLADDAWARFNDYQLTVTHFDGTNETFPADWSEISVTNFGAYITDIFPSVDMRLDYFEGVIKSELIVKENLNVKEFVLLDDVDLSDGIGIVLGDEGPAGGHFVELYDIESGETWGVLRPAHTYDSAPDAISWMCDYSISSGNLEIICDSAQINAEGLTYPVIIDPTFVAVGPVTSIFGVNGSRRWGNFCTSSMNVTFPGGSTPWDVQVGWQVYCNFCSGPPFPNCNMSTAYVWITSGCGGASPVGAPPTVWSCFPGCGTPGYWIPTIAFGSDGTSSLALCYPPSCADQICTFNLMTTRTVCNDNASDICNWFTNFCTALDQWSVTMQGKSVETLGDAVTGSGSITYFDADCVGSIVLDPLALYGVAPYTYLWSTAATTPTISVTATTSVYTCLVTDACGNAVTATFTISCPLDSDELQFTAADDEGQVYLNWKYSAGEDIDYYTIQKLDSKGNYTDLAHVQSENLTGNSYEWVDSWPIPGMNYYRLRIHNKNGDTHFSDIVQVDVKQAATVLTLFPNPTSGIFTLVWEDQLPVSSRIVLRDVAGRVVFESSLDAAVQQIDATRISKGLYLAEVFTGERCIWQQKLVLEK